MDRFKILKKQESTKPIAYSFQQTSTPSKVLEYIKRCIQDEVAFDASNIYPSVVDQALALLNKEKKFPIVTKSEKMARTLLLSLNFYRVYPIESLPENSNPVICYWDLNPRELPRGQEIALVIVRKKNENHK
jgi:hypothetical protein